jgi:anti-anti-sigma factor
MQASPLEITPVEDTPALAVLAVRGRLDTVGSRALAAAVEPRVAAPECRVVVLDLAGTTYLSSAALRVLTGALRTLQGRGGALLLCSVQEYCRDVIEIAGLAPHLPTFADRPAAQAEARRRLAAAAAVAGWADLERWETSGAAFTAVPGPGGTRGVVEILGHVQDILHASLDEEDVVSRRFDETEYSIGCGALGDELEDYFPIMGEMITIGGTMVWLPTDGGDTPDFLIPRRASRSVTLRTGFNAALHGGFDECLLVEARDPAGLPIDQLYRQIFDVARARRPDYRGVIGLAGRAEFTGVLGAGIRRSPIRRFQPANGQTILHADNLADWFAGDREPRLAGVTGLLCGVGVDLQADLSAFEAAAVDRAFYRHPDNTAGKPHLLHNHAVFFSPQPWNKRPADLAAEVARVVEQGDFRDMRHLLDQSRVSRAFLGVSYTQEIRGA